MGISAAAFKEHLPYLSGYPETVGRVTVTREQREGWPEVKFPWEKLSGNSK